VGILPHIMWKSTYRPDPEEVSFAKMTASEATLRAQRQGRRRAAEAAPFRLESHLFYYFSQILARRQRALNSELRRFGLDYARWRVMAVLNEEPGCSMQRLSDLTSVDRTTLTHTLRLMENEGLIARHERPSDRRSIAVSLTPHGADMLAQILPTVLAQTDLALDGFMAEEVDRLREQLGRIVANLKR
jgi:DNA-binding MarR family transcriptional regulator